jgi:sulfide dehydrogenase [flavocytochrome c] flavoprotein chain
MAQINRRRFIQMAGLGGLAAGFPYAATWGSQTKARVVVVGGGTGGAIAARYVKALDPAIDVTIIEAHPQHTTCYMSNWVLAEMRDLDSLTHGYDKVRARGINVIIDTATRIDTEGQKVLTAGGQSVPYDRLIVAPGIDFRWGAIEGYDAAAAEVLPHAWKAGPQTLLLQQQIQAMDDGGVVAIVAPPNPFRCPPGPYERAALIAHYLQRHKPKSKIVIYDAKDAFSKQGLFQAGWERHYPGMIEWVGAFTGGKHPARRCRRQDPAQRVRRLRGRRDQHHPAADGGAHRGRLRPHRRLRLVPGRLPRSAVHARQERARDRRRHGQQRPAEVRLHRRLHRQGRGGRRGRPHQRPRTRHAGVLQHLLQPAHPEHSISVSGVYKVAMNEAGQQAVVGVGNSVAVSPAGADDTFQNREARYAASWYDNLTDQGFGA